MATMVRVKPKEILRVSSNNPFLASAVPAPFPKEQLAQDVEPEVEISVDDSEAEAGPSHIKEGSGSSAMGTLHELMPSIAHVEKTCIMALNNLLSVPARWAPIVPDRRHSMPSSPITSSETDSSALQTLVSNLRNRDTGENMLEIHHGESDSELINELRIRIDSISPSLEPEDVQLSKTLVSLLSHFNRLAAIPSTSQARLAPSPSWTADSSGSVDLFSTLKRQLSDFQLERASSQQEVPTLSSTPVRAVDSALLWSRIDEELEKIVSMCKERTERIFSDHLPPQYDLDDYDDVDPLPEYEPGARVSLDGSKSKPPRSPTIANSHINEKMRLDLESVTMAIDRLYMVAPQLHNQRVELKSTKLEQMEKARAQGSSPKGKQKEKDVGELENIIRLIGKASERTFKDQSVILEGGMKARLEKARQRDNAKKAAFVEHLAQHSDSGRFHSQDAVLNPRIKDPEALLTLPEFIREAVPPESIRQDPKALLTLPEFVKEPLPPHLLTPSLPPTTLSRIKTKNRHRSMSAPSMSWLRPSSRSGHSTPSSQGSTDSISRTGFEVQYISENHENLQHVLVFLSVAGATPGVDIEAEVLPPLSDETLAGGDRLIVKSGANASLPLIIPGRVLAGKKEIKVQSEHYELKLSTLPSLLPSIMPSAPIPLLDAEQLERDSPTSFICSSCSLPLVQSSKVECYKDLPSEHWQELVDAWMCHSDQKLHDQVAKHSRGFWPEPGQALVGGSYILFSERCMVKNNLCPADQTKPGEDWRLVRCLCGAIVGRCQDHRASNGQSSTVYRFLKYAIRPVSLTAEPVKVPLSAFIVEDMKEFVHAHASYRFVIQDEEDEKPRILLWLFKPSMQIAYSTQHHYALPKSGCINAAKVLYKLIGPAEASTELKTILDKYPGFPQAEYLFYPMGICRQLAALLKESNRTYPESLRVLTGLEVGWLRRA